MNTIPVEAQFLLNRQADLEMRLNDLHDIINKAEKGLMGITLDSAKTPEWKEAKRLYSVYWDMYRDINSRLSKMRKAIGYENQNGKRVVIYKYKN